MQIYINDVIDEHRLNAITATLSNQQFFEDGKKTAGRTAKKAKNNMQACQDVPEVKGAIKVIEQSLLTNPVFNMAAIPKKFAKVMFSRYGTGMKYGTHIDEPVINGIRTDLSFTLFLSEPDEYDGGELILEHHSGEESIKLPKGSLCLYPSTSLHRVAEVRSGSRLAAVGWVQSRVRLADHREALFDLNRALITLPNNTENEEARLNLLKAKSNLMRLWMD